MGDQCGYMWDLGKHEHKKNDVIINYPARWGPYRNSGKSLSADVSILAKRYAKGMRKIQGASYLGWFYTWESICSKTNVTIKNWTVQQQQPIFNFHFCNSLEDYVHSSLRQKRTLNWFYIDKTGKVKKSRFPLKSFKV